MRPALPTLLLFMLITTVSCTGDYYFKNLPFTSRPVVVSMINPDSVISVSLFRSVPTDSKDEMVGIDGATVRVKENGIIVVQGRSVNGIYKSSYKPAEGKRYDLQVDIPGLPEISASTTIPVKPRVRATIRNKKSTDSFANGFILVDVESLEPSAETRGIWLSGDTFYDIGKSSKLGHEYYGSNPFFDQLNATTNPSYMLQFESFIVYERNFIRIERTNILLALPFTFSFNFFWERSIFLNNDYSNPVEVYTNKVEAYVLAASEEYDRFRRSAERQAQNYTTSFLFMTVPGSLQSNIKNGLGVFGGYSVTLLKTELSKPAK